jgi:hypothetical protein
MASGKPSDRSPEAGRGFFGWAAAATFAAWLVVTVSNHHPLSQFDRLRPYDRTGLLIPNWRFFAPEPAQHDFQILHRVLSADGEQSPWRQTRRFASRAWAHMIWFPDRRHDKALFDICNELLMAKGTGVRDVSRTAPYRLLRDFVAYTVRQEHAGGEMPQGFQFVIAQDAGHDEEREPVYLLVSEFVSLAGASE